MKKITHLQNGGYFAESDTWQAAYDFDGKRMDEPTNTSTAPLFLTTIEMKLANHSENCVCALKKRHAMATN